MFESVQLSALLISALAGVLIGIPTGPANFFVVDTCMKDGKKNALQVYGGVAVSKLLYAALALVFNELITGKSKIETIIYLVASVLLVLWGILIIVKSFKKSQSSIELNMDSRFKKGFVVGITNPAIPFIYLTLVQILKAYFTKVSFLQFLLNIAIFEIATFLTLSLISLLLLKNKGNILAHWNKVKFMMGVIIASLGTYQVIQIVEFDHGIKLNNQENMLEQQLEDKTDKSVK